MDKNWYVLHVLSGHENKVKNYIEAEAPLSGLGDQIGNVIVPTVDTIEMKINQASVVAEYNLESGEVSYQPDVPFSDGEITASLLASPPVLIICLFSNEHISS